ncbi:hypothetical protein [Streptomyces sp. NRRL F-2580]|uniref:hypothetical protein n=1 Tax=Streptomyces sp. NRRL F-2580 TaxID=1463841 RepID=UPI000ADCE8C5|nr:hypothetical protein [Streptomyces sp. NRRL F-2580]
MVAHQIEHEVVVRTAAGEVLPGGADDVVGAGRADPVRVPYAPVLYAPVPSAPNAFAI